MKVFPDTNVLVAAHVARDFCADLVRLILAPRATWELLRGTR